MLETVESLFDKQASVWSSFVPLANTKNELSAIVNSIQQEYATTLIRIKGVTQTKKGLRNALEAMAFYVSNGLCAYASAMHLAELYDNMHDTKSSLKMKKDAELIGQASLLHQTAQNLLTQLAPYQITAAVLAQLQSSLNDFSEVVHAPKENIAKRRDAAKQVNAKIEAGMALLKTRMDALVHILKSTEPSFADLYKIARNIKNSPTHRRALTIVCKDALTQQAVPGVELWIDAKKTKRTSGAKGKSYVQHLPGGTHSLQANHPDYVSQTISFTCIDNLNVVVEVLLHSV